MESKPSRAMPATESRNRNRSDVSIFSTILGSGGSTARSSRIFAAWAGVSGACWSMAWSPSQAMVSMAMATRPWIVFGSWPVKRPKR